VNGDNENDAICRLELLYLDKNQKALFEIANNEKMPYPIRRYAHGLLARPWLPWRRGKKAMMAGFFLAGLAGVLFTGNLLFASFVAFALLLSPRLANALYGDDWTEKG